VGYFRSSVFILIGSDLLKFVKRGGKIRLISSPYLTEDDVKAISEGYKGKIDGATDAIQRDIELLLSNKEIVKNTEALATLISINAMEVKLVFMPYASGDYHAKLGLFYDETNDAISFKGSINETWTGWHKRGNHETLDVFYGWREGRDKRQVRRDQEYFEKLWCGNVEDLEVIDFPQAALNRLKIAAKGSLDEIDPNELVDYFNLSYKTVGEESRLWGTKVRKRMPLQHQLDAIREWIKQGKRGILEHATGSGKTFTAITALKEHLGSDGVALILVPDKLLLRQWAKELREEIENVSLLKAGDGNNDWKKYNTLRDFTSPLEGLGVRVVLAIMKTARTEAFLSGINQGQHLMLVVDEVHEIGSQKNYEALTIDTGSRLGLSATPKRYGDSVGTAKILNYFGPIIQPPYTLAKAILDRRLVPYEYYPKAIRLTAEESERWAKETKKISKEYARSKRDLGGNAILSSYLQNLIIQRARIAKKAWAKAPLAVSILKENYKDGESWLVYCEDQFQLREIKDALKREGFNPLEYHTNMEGNAEAALGYFKDFGGILCSIKCLDQGIDIPKISHAIILASSQNPRQFIQRRGRVLRICKGKDKAIIYDAIVVPVSLELEPEQLSLLKSEFQRSIQFAKSALNSSAAHELMYIAIQLNIDPEEVGLTEGDGIEEENADA